MDEFVRIHRSWLWEAAREQMSPRLRRFCASEDVVQEALVSLLRSGPSFLPNSEIQLRAMLRRIVLNRILDLVDYAGADRRTPDREESLGSRPISRVGPVDHSSALPSRRAEQLEEQNRVRLAMDLLRPEDRRILLLGRYEGLTAQQIGEHLGITADTAKKRLQRATIRLGRTLTDLATGDLRTLREEAEMNDPGMNRGGG